MKPVSSSLETEAHIPKDGLTIDADIKFDYHPAPPVIRTGTLALPDAASVEISLTDFPVEKYQGT
ncbi:MAG TPA: hypothetical protein VD994_21905, partial [Prosthecobacter sp.]|nr:hypothetical protein [Prosthecobacter sp.]